MKPILIISGEFGVREVYDTDDELKEFQDEDEDLHDRPNMEIGSQRPSVP